MSPRRSASPLLLATILAAGLCACGGDDKPPIPQQFDVSFVVFYDQNENGIQDGDEQAVVPNATIQVDTVTGVTVAGTGATTLRLEEGTRTATISELPPYYQRGPAVSVTVPVADGQPVRMPATLPIGTNHPNVYMAFGDSITDGDGSTDEAGYRNRLQAKLDPWFGAGSIVNQAIGGTRSNAGADRINDSLDATTPAYTLILYGTNDWNDSHCRSEFPCFTIDSLRHMVRAAKNAGSKPILSTIIPCNTGYDARVPPSRNAWIEAMNRLIATMAKEEDVVLVDPYTAFMTAVPDFHTLMFDHVHPNDAGYDILAQVWFDGISQKSGESALSREPLLLPPPGSFPETIPSDPADVPRAPRWGAR